MTTPTCLFPHNKGKTDFDLKQTLGLANPEEQKRV